MFHGKDHYFGAPQEVSDNHQLKSALKNGICKFPGGYPFWNTLLQTNSSHLEMDGWKTSLSSSEAIFSGRAVSFREGNFLLIRTCQFLWCKSELCFLVVLAAAFFPPSDPVVWAMSTQDASSLSGVTKPSLKPPTWLSNQWWWNSTTTSQTWQLGSWRLNRSLTCPDGALQI